jgi:excisionase family DNA binding protein
MPRNTQQTSRTEDASTFAPSPLPHLIDVTDLAEHLGVEVRHVRRLVHERRIPFIKWGHLVRFDPDQVSAWLEANRIEPYPPRPR